MLKREVESWVYNLMLAGQVECWGLKLIFGSLSSNINFECWNVKLKVECYNLILASQVECWELKLAGIEHHTLWHSFIDLSIHPFLRMFVCSSCWHWPTKPASQPSVISFQSFISSIRILSFFFSFTFHSFVRSFICLFIHSFYWVW